MPILRIDFLYKSVLRVTYNTYLSDDVCFFLRLYLTVPLEHDTLYLLQLLLPLPLQNLSDHPKLILV